MLTSDGCRARRERLVEALAAASDGDAPDWIVIGDPGHLVYFANYYADPFVFRSANAAAVLIFGRDGQSILVADNLVRGYADRAHVDRRLAPAWYDGEHTAGARGPRLVEKALAAISELPGGHFGLESARTPAGVLEGLLSSRPGCRITPVDRAIHEMKRRKDADELALLRRSIAAIEAGFAAARQDVRAGMTEMDAFHVVERASREALGELAPIYGDFASGPNTQAGGGPPSLRRIDAGDLFLLDYSVVVYGYRGDFAATWVVDAVPDDRARRLRDACREAMLAGEGLLRPGTRCRDVDRAVRASFEAKGLAENFTSHSGHGLGLGHPDPPYIVPRSDDELLEGDVVTLEPSQKVPGFGTIRIEHNYLITADGFEQLSQHSLSLEAEEAPIRET
jgi:Xaa-Pro aminopeptidase